MNQRDKLTKEMTRTLNTLATNGVAMCSFVLRLRQVLSDEPMEMLALVRSMK